MTSRPADREVDVARVVVLLSMPPLTIPIGGSILMRLVGQDQVPVVNARPTAAASSPRLPVHLVRDHDRVVALLPRRSWSRSCLRRDASRVRGFANVLRFFQNFMFVAR